MLYSRRSLGLQILFFSLAAQSGPKALAQGAVNPWASQNSGVVTTPPPPGVPVRQVPGQAVQIPVVNPVGVPSAGSQSNGANPAAQIMQQMMNSLGGKRSEFADGNGGGQNAYLPNGVGSSLETSGSGGTGPAGASLVNVNACSNQPGKFQFKFGHYGKDSGCDGQIKMNEDLTNFMNNQLGRCVNQAAGSNSFTSGKIYHAGTMGNEAHQRTGSLHNYGLAIDINTIEIDGKPYSYKDKRPAVQSFFTKLRQCWGEAANRERAGCLPTRSSGMPHGTIGDEDHRHHNHLHLSLPMCRQYAGNAFMAWYFELLINAAHAEDATVIDESKLMPPPSKFKTKKVAVPEGVAHLSIEDTGGEPIGADQLISLKLKCAKQAQARTLIDQIDACAFEDFRYNKATSSVEIYYRTAIMRDGKVACQKREVSKTRVNCR